MATVKHGCIRCGDPFGEKEGAGRLECNFLNVKNVKMAIREDELGKKQGVMPVASRGVDEVGIRGKLGGEIVMCPLGGCGESRFSRHGCRGELRRRWILPEGDL